VERFAALIANEVNAPITLECNIVGSIAALQVSCGVRPALGGLDPEANGRLAIENHPINQSIEHPLLMARSNQSTFDRAVDLTRLTLNHLESAGALGCPRARFFTADGDSLRRGEREGSVNCERRHLNNSPVLDIM
jgi:hypothetical protein